MRPVVANLTNEDLVNVAAYVSSLMPTSAPSSPQR
jgi:cytochrome c553